jgi:uncharacterized protein
MWHLLGYVFSLFIGISLGLIGGGGSILTVPILVYIFQLDPVLATSYSLFIVGMTSATGAFKKYKEGEVDLKIAVVFGIPSIISVYTTRKFLIPAIPAHLFSIGSLEITKPLFLLLIFAILMVAASISMIKGNGFLSRVKVNKDKINYPVILLDGIAVGTLTGFAGAGGGFLIIPALVFLSGLEMKRAIGTSLLIIASNTLFGFIGDHGHYQPDWLLLLSITAIAVAGIFIGHSLSKKIHGDHLKKGFGWFVLATGCYILVRELFFQAR